jgi:hypothetical protein
MLCLRVGTKVNHTRRPPFKPSPVIYPNSDWEPMLIVARSLTQFCWRWHLQCRLKESKHRKLVITSISYSCRLVKTFTNMKQCLAGTEDMENIEMVWNVINGFLSGWAQSGGKYNGRTRGWVSETARWVERDHLSNRREGEPIFWTLCPEHSANGQKCMMKCMINEKNVDSLLISAKCCAFGL